MAFLGPINGVRECCWLDAALVVRVKGSGNTDDALLRMTDWNGGEGRVKMPTLVLAGWWNDGRLTERE